MACVDGSGEDTMVQDETLRAGLWRLAGNVRWAWTPAVRELFEELDPDGWRRTGPRSALISLRAPSRSALRRRQRAAVRNTAADPRSLPIPVSVDRRVMGIRRVVVNETKMNGGLRQSQAVNDVTNMAQLRRPRFKEFAARRRV
jgi:hypothetical protein